VARSNSSSVRRMPSQPVSTGVPKRARSWLEMGKWIIVDTSLHVEHTNVSVGCGDCRKLTNILTAPINN